MLRRKVFTALIVSTLSIISMNFILPIFDEAEDFVFGFIIYASYFIPVIFIYGIATSIISDGIGFKAKKHKEAIAFGLHILFGIGFIISYSIGIEYNSITLLTLVEIAKHPITLAGFLLSIIFYFVDRVLKRLIKPKSANP